MLVRVFTVAQSLIARRRGKTSIHTAKKQNRILVDHLCLRIVREGFACFSDTMVHSIRPLVLSGPSGSGKSTLLRRLFEEFPNKFGFSVSHTTRSPRPGEVNGKHYHFTTKEDMGAAIERGEFIENAVFSNNMYGTSKAAVASVQAEGKVCVLDIEIEGVKQVKQTDLNPLFVFIKPPSMEELEKRLRDRNTETEESLQRRLTTAHAELAYADIPNNFHLVLVNDNLEKAYVKFRDFILSEMEKSSPTSSDFWCCLGSTSTDRSSDDYYYMSTNVSNDNASPENYSSEITALHIPPGTVADDQPAVAQETCLLDSGGGSNAACASMGWGSDSLIGCDSGGGFDSGGACDSGGGGGCDSGGTAGCD